MTKLNEREIIDLFFSRLLEKNESSFNTKDDVSVISFKNLKKITNRIINTNNLIIKSDMLVESTDVPKQMKAWQSARKSIVSVISDMSAKGIKPPFISLISIGIPKHWTKNKITDLVLGFEKASKEFQVIFLGGDTNESKELIIDCMLIGFLDSTKNNIPMRNTALPGDLIIISGEFGYSSAGFKILLNNLKATKLFKKKAVKKVLEPRPRQKFGTILSKYFSSSIDSSDGLSISLYELAKQSKVNFLIDHVPISNDLEKFSQMNSVDVFDLIFYGGEEYEILATINPSNLQQIKLLAKKNNLNFFIIGVVVKGNGNVFFKSNNSSHKKNNYLTLKNKGYLHFS